ncbi:DotI/IcmL family type IV secretion protein [Pseudomonas sp. UMAB-40]|uniref:DotI/IcmL family type IV secretion protein n=1 Tax=Pseudomonas sp. UMAB-40 TaxID=1365407 RepID=UPI001C55C994|nr:DotI/IcmL family type IV secretion protein [Pseudomonas sp. UMAB-40]
MANTNEQAKDTARQNSASEQSRISAALEKLLDMNGLLATIEAGLSAREDKTVKNRIIATLLVFLGFSMGGNAVQYAYQPPTKLLGETIDGRIRDLPLLSEPIYEHKQILEWATKCVQSMYRLSYVEEWDASLKNNALCLSDGGISAFGKSLKKVGLTDYLTRERQGTMFATTGMAEMRSNLLGNKGYYEWVVYLPYRVNIDGKSRGTMDLTIAMKIRRVSLVIRGDGLWVESFRIRPRSDALGK